jgi:general stress protein 26
MDSIEPTTAPDRLADLPADTARRLAQAVRDRDAAMHAPVVVTSDGDARIMVLRAADPTLAALRFHTDARSPKLAQFAADPRLTILAYDPHDRVQLRLTGLARVEQTGLVADAAWAAASALNRRCYLAQIGPGGALAAPGSALPADLQHRRPTLAETEAGRANFAVIVATITAIDWLQLGRDGGMRAQLHRAGDAWQGAWVAP